MHSFESICERYGITKGALSQYIRPRIEEINKDGEHIIRSGQKIYFDDVAVQRLDKMRNFTSNIELASEIASQKQKIDLLDENRKLRILLSKLQQDHTKALADANATHKKLEEMQQHYIETSKVMRLESAQDKAAAEAAKKQAAAIAEEKKQIQQELQAAMQNIGQYKAIAQVNADAAEQAKAALMQAQEKQLASERKIAELQETATAAQEELKAERNKSIWQKIFGR